MSVFQEVHIFQKRKPKKKDELWLISYADLVTNLMAVFIMMLAISSIDMAKFEAITSHITQTAIKNTLDDLKHQIDAEISKRQLSKKVRTDLGMFGLNVEFLSGVLFASASAELSPEALIEAKPIMEILSKTDKKYIMAFEGHTDDIPIKKNGKFRDNWDLSTARGAALLSVMKNLGVMENRMSVAGYAHTRPKVSIVDKKGSELEAARASNRRVVIRVYQ